MSAWVVPLLVVVLTALVGGQLALTWRGRLPRQIQARLNILDKLPEGEVHGELRMHVERQVRYLIAHDDALSLNDRLRRRWGWLYILAGVIAPVAFALETGNVGTLFLVASLVGLALITSGVWTLMGVGRRTEQRLWDRLKDADDARDT